MALYSIADLHLSHTANKPMDKFGSRWTGHTEKIKTKWSRLVTDTDTVVIPGDISWAMELSEAADDLLFIDSLPGKKIISRGNHDYWWATVTKMKSFLGELGISSIDFLQNNAFFAEGAIIAGSRGWYIEPRFQNTQSPTDYKKIVERECVRLELSLDSAEKLREKHNDSPVLVYLHFPPVFGDFVCRPIVDVMKKHAVKNCFFGHIHGKYSVPQSTVYEGVKMTLISADFLDFIPYRTDAFPQI